MGNIVCCLVELNTIQLSIEKNDLKDRKTISLYGQTHDTKLNASRALGGDSKNKNIPIKLDTKCIS